MFEVLATNEEVAITLDPAYIAEVSIYHPQQHPLMMLGPGPSVLEKI
jgi:hypothetical protein